MAPKTSQSVIQACRLDYEAGNFKSVVELAERYSINSSTLQCRIAREGWKEKKAKMLTKISEKIEKKALSQAEEYFQRSLKRAVRYEGIIDSSLDQLAIGPNGQPQCEPSDLDAYTRSEQRIQTLAFNALRVPLQAQVDLTSQGQSIGSSLVAAIESMRAKKVDVSPELYQAALDANSDT